MRVSVIGCGDTAKEWFKVPCHLSVGVNDCFKFGHDPDYLIVVNSPEKFKNGRLQTIIQTRPRVKFITHLPQRWKKYFPNLSPITNRVTFTNRAIKDRIHCSKTSPFIAMSFAYNLGAREIILWGVDFKTHKDYREDNRIGRAEINRYVRFAEIIEKRDGVKVFVSSYHSALSKYLPVYQPAIVLECDDHNDTLLPNDF